MANLPRLEERELPLVIRPGGEEEADRSVDGLCQWLKDEAARVQGWLTEHGAILFRGFAVEVPEDFEQLARAIDPELKNEYLGTSPRDALTDYVFNASELPDYYPIPQHCEMTWLPGDALRLVHSQPVTRDHPVTGERVWHNHLTTFHTTTAVQEYERIVAFRPTERHRGLLKLARSLEEQAARKSADEQSMHTTYLDGSEIPREDVAHVRDVVWRHLVATPWERGDVVAIDNHSTSHGRLPYEGPRHVAVCWA